MQVNFIIRLSLVSTCSAGRPCLLNAGLISTEAGTIGRLCGNFLLSVVAKFTGDTSLTQLTHFGQTLFGLLAAITAASLGYMIAIWKRMAC